MRPLRVALVLVLGATGACGEDPEPGSDGAASDASEDIADTGLDIQDDGADIPITDVADAREDMADGRDVDVGGDVGPVEFLSTPASVIQAGVEWVYALELSGEAVPTLAAGPEGATLEATFLTWEPPPTGISTADFVIDAIRAGETVATQVFSVDVNHRPVFLDVPSANAFVGQEWEHWATVSDEDSDQLEWRLQEAPDWLSISEDGLLSGTPNVPGTARFMLGVSDGRGGDALQESQLTVIEPIRDLRANTYVLENRDPQFSIFGCCFSGDGPAVYWGGEELVVDVVNAGRLDLDFTSPPVPSEAPVVLIVDDVVAGELPFPLAIFPDPLADSGVISLQGVAGAMIRVLTFDLEVLETTRSEEDTWTSEALAGVVFAEVNGVRSRPIWVSDAAISELISVSPRLHSPGDAVTFEFSAEVTEPIVASWGDENATCFPSDRRHCVATVPARASGFVGVSAAGIPVDSLTSAVAGSPAGLGSGDWIDWASRTTLRMGVPSLVLVSTLGGAPTAAGADLELVELGDTYALVLLVADGLSASIEVRGDHWHFDVE